MGDSQRAEMRFDSTILEEVDEGLLVLGESARCMIYRHILKNYSMRREDIPGKLKKFMEGLEDLLGNSSLILGKSIAKSIYARVGLDFEEKAGWGLPEYVEEAKKRFQL